MPETVLPDGRSVQFWLGGADSGAVVLFFHGCPDTRWAARTGDIAAREAGARLLCVNRQGYGRSALADSTHTSAAGDAMSVADILGIGEVSVLGMSVGGGYAAACAAAYADRVRRLGVVATLPPPAEEPDVSVTAAMARIPDARLHVVPGATHLATLLRSWEEILTALLH